MKFFIDTADVEQIREMVSLGVLDGVTTNPTLVAKTGRKFDDVAKEILELVDGPVSLEVVSLKSEEMLGEARTLARMGDNVVVKIPMTMEGMKAVKTLTSEGIKTNVTLVFSANQALIAAKAGATYVSPFIGRLDDNGQDGLDLIEEILDIYDNYGYETEVIAASIRHPIHVVECARMGCHVATVPYPILRKMFGHPLTDNGIEQFLADWEKVPKK